MNKNLSFAFKKTFAPAFTRWLLGGFGTLSSVLLAGKNYLNYTVKISITAGLILILALYLARFIGFFLRATYVTYVEKKRQNVYGTAIVILNDAFAKLHLLRKHETFSEVELVNTMRHLCQQLKLIFDSITGVDSNAVSIKVPVKREDEIAFQTRVRNLARDKNSFIQRETTTYNEAEHKIVANTCYYEILNKLTMNEKDNLFYLNNNIPTTENYHNSSKDCHVDGKLPYNSELVVPIIPLSRDHSNIYTVAGFLCVDCNKINAYEGLYDVAILQGVADGIYDLIRPDMPKIKQVSTETKAD